jgi:hypothetical protein
MQSIKLQATNATKLEPTTVEESQSEVPIESIAKGFWPSLASGDVMTVTGEFADFR